MILYLGSSSLIKLYVNEHHAEAVRGWVRAAEIVATCRIAYTEIMSALDIRLRKGDISKEDYELVSQKFSEDWKDFAKVDFDDLEAGNMAKKYGVTRFGALHLSAAKLLLTEYKNYKRALESEDRQLNGVDVFFSSDDKALCKAAMSEGLEVLPLG